MALALNSTHALASRVKVLIGVDPAAVALVDLARAGVAFTLDAGLGYVDTPLGKGVRCTGSGYDYKGFAFNDYAIPTQVAFEGTLFIVVSRMTGFGSNGTHPVRLPGSTLGSAAMMVGFNPSTGNLGINDGNLSTGLVEVSPARSIAGDNQWHSFAVRQWNAAGWSTLAGDLFVDGVATNAAMSGKLADTMHLNGFARNPSTSWAGDFVWLAYFDKKLSATEIADLHASLAAGNTFALVTGSAPAPALPAGTPTIQSVTPTATSASVAYAYAAADATGFAYSLNGGAATALGASPASIAGLAAGTAYTLRVCATNATGAGPWSAPASFTTTALPPADTTAPTLAGSVAIGSLTTSGYTASWPAGTDNVGVTGYEYRLNAGAWTAVGKATSAAISGRSAGSTDTFEVRAFDAAGNRSVALSATVKLAAVGGSVVVTDALKNNAGAVQAGLAGIRCTVLRASDLVAVATVGGLTTNAAGVLAPITHAAIVAGTPYHVAIKTSAGGTGITGPITAS